MPSLVSKSTRWFDRGLHLLLPRVCSLCEQNLEGDLECAARLCAACEDRLPGRMALRCFRCGLAHDRVVNQGVPNGQVPPEEGHCALDRQERFPWDGVIAWLDYEYPIDGWIRALKFQQEASLAHGLGWGLAQAILRAPLDQQKRISQLDALIPLPLSRQRLAKRGFNQAQLITQSLSKTLSPALGSRHEEGRALNIFPRQHRIRLDLLRRSKDGPAMSLLPSQGRHHLVKDAYQVPHKIHFDRSEPASLTNQLQEKAHRQDFDQAETPLRGMRLGLIDDVMTTGATLAEATRCLKAAGASEVIAIVAARTPAMSEFR